MSAADLERLFGAFFLVCGFLGIGGGLALVACGVEHLARVFVAWLERRDLMVDDEPDPRVQRPGSIEDFRNAMRRRV